MARIDRPTGTLWLQRASRDEPAPTDERVASKPTWEWTLSVVSQVRVLWTQGSLWVVECLPRGFALQGFR